VHTFGFGHFLVVNVKLDDGASRFAPPFSGEGDREVLERSESNFRDSYIKFHVLSHLKMRNSAQGSWETILFSVHGGSMRIEEM
jgi:hypothetical protein